MGQEHLRRANRIKTLLQSRKVPLFSAHHGERSKGHIVYYQLLYIHVQSAS
jgi:hypothetical protein